MKVLMISRDTKVLNETSSVFLRVKEYSNLFDELSVVVLAKKSNLRSFSTSKLHIYNATSRSKIISFSRSFTKALKIARKDKDNDTWITSQDPFESGLLAYMVAKLTHIKLQLQFHTDCFNILFIKQNIANYVRTMISRFLISKADSIRVVSEHIKETLLNMNKELKDRIFVLPVWTDILGIKEMPIDPRYDLKEKFPEFTKIILIVARLESEKNIGLSLLAFKKALRFDPKIGLIIAGAGQQENWLKDLAKLHGILNNIKFLGWVSDVSSLFKTADLLLVTSNYEGYGLNMIEAAACGCPVVSTDVGVAKEVGATIVPYDAGEIALAIIDMLNKGDVSIIKDSFIISKQEYLNQFKNTFNI